MIVACERRGCIDVTKGHVRNPSPSLLRQSSPRVFHEDLTHRPGSDGQEMGSVLPRGRCADELEEGLVYEIGCVQGVTRTLSRQCAARSLSQLVVDQGKQPLERRAVSVAGTLQERCDVAGDRSVAHLCHASRASPASVIDVRPSPGAPVHFEMRVDADEQDIRRKAAPSDTGGVGLASLEDTIAALSSAPGRAAIAIVRMTGPQTNAIAARLLRPWPSEPRHATRCAVVDGDGISLDDAVVVRYAAPRSYTGEDLIEIMCHGGAVVPATVLAALVSAGAREALPGEFTRRAVLAGKLDLLQAEAIADLVNARWRSEQRAALAQLDGGLSRRVLSLRDALLEVEALVAYDIDFPEEDDGPISRSRVMDAVDGALKALDSLLATTRAGEMVREGAMVVIAGEPNVGKSSLFNAVLGRRRAIVTDVPGTTRDALEAAIDGARWPIRLVDTAGLRESADAVERLGIEVSGEYLRGADVVLACGDDDASLRHVLGVATKATQAPVIAVRTKSDLGGATEADVHVSAERGEGISALIEAIERKLDERTDAPSLDAPLLTRARHEHAVRRARDELAAFRDAWGEHGLPATVAAIHLREGAAALESLVGAIDVDEVLGRVFERFCVGK
jgi:tRNA modification GTPase